jgi:hypothetical protein
MTGFEAQWLALREGADRRARDSAIRDAAALHFARRDEMTIVDLACGAGSNTRALAPYLCARQSWRLVDHDAALLDSARTALTHWADAVEGEKPLTLRKNDRRLEIAFEQLDLNADLSRALDGADLVSAAAFFDLVSAQWIEAFCAELARRRLPLYAVLTYDGKESWTPPHKADAAMLAAFHRHQARDKGFGPAAGPRAGAILQETLELAGYAARVGSSPWRLGEGDAELTAALADGAAEAVAQTGLVEQATIADWRAARRNASGCEIGHADMFATPRRIAGAYPTSIRIGLDPAVGLH